MIITHSLYVSVPKHNHLRFTSASIVHVLYVPFTRTGTMYTTEREIVTTLNIRYPQNSGNQLLPALTMC